MASKQQEQHNKVKQGSTVDSVFDNVNDCCSRRSDDASYRLPSWLSPVSYELHFAPSPATGMFTGVADITCRLVQEDNNDRSSSGGAPTGTNDTNEVTLHALGIMFQRGSITYTTPSSSSSSDCERIVKEIAVDGIRYLPLSETAVVPLPVSMEALQHSEAGIFHDTSVVTAAPANSAAPQQEGSTTHRGSGPTFVLQLEYTGMIYGGEVTGQSFGLFRWNTANDPNCMVTHLEPTNARRLYPCFDEPSFKATYRVSVDFDATYQVVSGTNVASEILLNADNDDDVVAGDSTTLRPKMSASCSNESPLLLSTTGRLQSAEYVANVPAANTTGTSPTGKTGGGEGGSRSGSVSPSVRRASTNPTLPPLAPLDGSVSSVEVADSSGTPYNNNNNSTVVVRRTTFAPTPLLSTYLVSFAIGKFHMLQQNTKRRGLLCRVLFPTTDALNEGWYALDLLTKAVDFYEQFFQFDLPLEKLDIIGISEFSVLGMENWGMMTFLKEFLLVSETTSIERRQRIARLIGHEVAHQWYGNLISVAWWKHLWLKEGFCRYLEFFFVNHTFPQWGMWSEFMTQVLDEALQQDCRLEKTHPVESCSANPRHIFDSFDVISYGKGASLLRMLASSVGEVHLEAAIQQLVRRFVHGVFSKEDFLECLETSVAGDQSKAELCRLIINWVAVSGHPLLIVRRDDERFGGTSAANSEPSASGSSFPKTAALLSTPRVQLSGSTGMGHSNSSSTSRGEQQQQHSSNNNVSTPRDPGAKSYLRVSQYKMPDLSSGILPYYLRVKREQFQTEVAENVARSQRRASHAAAAAAAAPVDADDPLRPSEPSADDVTLDEEIDARIAEQQQRRAAATIDMEQQSPDSQPEGDDSDTGAVVTRQQRIKRFLWNPCDVLSASAFTIPLALLDLVHGQSSVRRNVVVHKSTCSFELEHGGDSLTYFNYCATAVARCDYDVTSWLRVFEYSPFLTAQDRLAITMTLFRLRTLHIGQIFPDENQDRCTLLLEWLVQISQQRSIHSTLWRYITEQVEVLLYLLRDHPCWSTFAEFIGSMYHHPMQLGLVSFHTLEKPVDFQAHGSLSAQTTMHILQNLAVCKNTEMLPEAQDVVDWALSDVLPDAITHGNNPLGGGGAGGAGGGTGSGASTPTNRNKKQQPQQPHAGSGVSFLSQPSPAQTGCVLPRTPAEDGTPAASPQPYPITAAASQLQHGGGMGTSVIAATTSPSSQSMPPAAAVPHPSALGKTFDIRSDTDVTKTTIAMQMTVEAGDVQRWWKLASVLAVALNIDLVSFVNPVFLARHELVPLPVDPSNLEGPSAAASRNRWINILAPPVFSLDEPDTFLFSITAIQCFSGISAPVAKAIIRNTKLITALLERPDGCQVGVRNGLLGFSSVFCSNINVMALFKCSLLGVDPAEAAVLSPRSLSGTCTPHTTGGTRTGGACAVGDPGSSGTDASSLASDEQPAVSPSKSSSPSTYSISNKGVAAAHHHHHQHIELVNIRKTNWPSTVTPMQSSHMQRMEMNCAWVDYVCDYYNSFLKAKRKEGAWVGPGATVGRMADSDPPIGSPSAPTAGGVSI